MSKRVKAPTDPRMWRVNQRAHKFRDRKKAERRNACRKNNKGGWS